MAMLRFLVVALAVAPGFVGCASVLGIETATHDPALDTAGAANGGNGGSGGGGGDTGGGGQGGDQGVCGTYCDTIQANCTGANEQYVSRAVCMRICARLDPGQPGDDVGNTVNCRLHYAESVATAGEPATNCSSAGPGGAQADAASVCGSYCEGLCRIALDTCNAQRIFNSVSECVSSCGSIPDLGNYADSIQSGNSVQCRLYHVSAAQIDPVLHCPHVTGLVGPCKVP